MAIRMYDQAVVDKINSWVNTKELRVLSPKESIDLFKMIADENGDKKIKLPLIAITRDSEVEFDYPHKSPRTFDGAMLEATETYAYQLNELMMTLKYQIDIYTRYADEGDELLRNMMFNLINDPLIVVELPYNNQHVEHHSHISVSSSVTDNSDTTQRMFHDQFTRWTINISIDDAHLFSIPKLDVTTAEIVSITADGTSEPL